MTTSSGYLVGVLAGVFLLRALVFATKQLWLNLGAERRIRAADQKLAAHVASNYSNRFGTLERRSSAR